MPRCSYLTPDGEQRFVWLNARCANMVALLGAATRKPDIKRARTTELLSVVAWESPRGLLATHALCLSAISTASQVISIGPGHTDANNLGLVCELAAELPVLAAALTEDAVAPFDEVGVVCDLPGGTRASSCHAAVRIVLADVRARVEPIFRDLGLLGDAESWEQLAKAAAAKGEHLLEELHNRLAAEYYGSLVKRWEGWRRIERSLVAEIAGAARAGLIPSENGGKLDQSRFDAAVENVLLMQSHDDQQSLFSRWRSIAQVMRFMKVGDELLLLGSHRAEIEGLARLTAEVLATVSSPKADAPGLLTLLECLRELQSLIAREHRIVHRGELRIANTEFMAEVQKCLGALHPAVRDATKDVDHLSLMRPSAPAPDASPIPPRKPQGKTNPQIDAIAYDLLCTAWDNPDPKRQYCPPQKKLAETVHARLSGDGISMQISSVLTAIKQRCPRTGQKWNEIQTELAKRNLQRRDRAAGDGSKGSK